MSQATIEHSETRSAVSAADTRSVARNAGQIKPLKSETRRLKYMALWSRQMHVLLHSGTPLAQALQAVSSQSSDKQWQALMSEVCARVDEGGALSDVMASYPTYFDPVCRSLVSAGESAGNLDSMLSRLAALSRQQLRVRRSIIGALVYPAILIFVAVSVMIVMIGFVLPRFAELFETLDVPLPPSTSFLVMISDAFRAYWWAFGIGVVASFFGLKAALASTPGKRMLDAWTVSVPHFGSMFRNFATARLARILGVLTQGHVSLIEALELTRESTTNYEYTKLLEVTIEGVTRGEPISAIFARSPLISASLSEAIRHGEKNGQVGAILTDMAEFMDEENETLVKTLSSVLEPIILIILGAVVAFVALSMFLPLFDLTSMT